MAELPQIRSIKTPDASIVDKTKKRRFKYINFSLIIVAALLVSYGLMIVFSAIYGNDDYSFSRSLSGVAIGLVFMALIWRFDYRKLADYTIVLLIINVVLILSPHLPLIGVEAKGATSWIEVFGIQIQPGEFAKLTVILLAASLVAQYGGKIDNPKEYLKLVGILAIPFVCIMTQPDMGTGMVYLFIAAIALLVGGARPKYLIITVALLAAAVVGLFMLDPVLDNALGQDVLLKNYQRQRLLVFMDPSYDLTEAGYNLAQAKIAIGSGGLFGKGFMQGTQSSLGFLPEAPTDFIFCVLAEELGFFGVMILLVLYVALILVCFRIASQASDLFGVLIVLCIAGMWLFQILQNIGMTCGLMPITGIPLPFLSYGSSFMLLNFMLIGLAGSVWAHNGR